MSATDLAQLEHVIEAAFDNRDTVSTSTKGEIRDAVETAPQLLDTGQVRVAARGEDGTWTVHQWLKKAVLLSFRLNDMDVVKGGPGASTGGTRCPRSSKAGAKANSARPVPRRPERRRASLGLHLQGRRPDAVLRQSRRLCR